MIEKQYEISLQIEMFKYIFSMVMFSDTNDIYVRHINKFIVWCVRIILNELVLLCAHIVKIINHPTSIQTMLIGYLQLHKPFTTNQ